MKKNIVPIELLFSIIIVSIIIVIIVFVSVNIKIEIQNSNKYIEVSTIATNILENINSRTYDGVTEYVKEFAGVGVTKVLEENVQNIVIDGNEFNDTFFGVEIPNGYVLEFNAKKTNESFDIIKEISLNIKYDINSKEENFNISTIIEKENIEECNSPIISDKYFEEFGINSDEYDIIPIKYSSNSECFITTNQNDYEWYNYSAKKWAKVLVFSRDAENLKDLFIDENGIIKNQINYDNIILDIKNYIYVWIPNFSIKDNISYFRYGTSKKAIKMDFQYVNNNYLYLNKVSEEIKDISKDCSFDGIYGVWRKLGEEDEYYKNFNTTKYAPINLY